MNNQPIPFIASSIPTSTSASRSGCSGGCDGTHEFAFEIRLPVQDRRFDIRDAVITSLKQDDVGRTGLITVQSDHRAHTEVLGFHLNPPATRNNHDGRSVDFSVAA